MKYIKIVYLLNVSDMSLLLIGNKAMTNSFKSIIENSTYYKLPTIKIEGTYTDILDLSTLKVVTQVIYLTVDQVSAITNGFINPNRMPGFHQEQKLFDHIKDMGTDIRAMGFQISYL